MVSGNSEESTERQHHQGAYDARDFSDLAKDFEEWKKTVTKLSRQVHGDGDRELMDESLQTRVREHQKFIDKTVRILLWFGAALASLIIHAGWKILSPK